MELQYLYGNPRPAPKKKPTIKKKFKRSAKRNPVIVSANPLSKKEVEAVRKQFLKEAKKPVKKKTVKAVKKAVRKTVKKTVKKTKGLLTAKDIQLIKQLSKNQGAGSMAKQKAKTAKKSTKKKARSVAKKVAKKSTRKKAKSVAKKVAKKVRKSTKKRKASARKVSTKTKAKRTKSRRKAKKTIKAVGGTITKTGKTYRRKSRKSKTVKAKHTKLSNNARKLKKGQKLIEVVQYAPKRRKNKKTGKVKIGKSKLISVRAVALNPRRKKKKNPLVMSNPRFMRNPIGSVGSKIVGLENKIIGSNGFKKVDGIAKKFLNAGVLEVAGLALGAGFDGQIVKGFDWLSAKVPMLGEQLAKIPAKYKSSVLVGGTGLALHALNTMLAKKSGKKSQVIDEVSKGLIAASFIKLIANISPYSVESMTGSGAVAGINYTPAMSGRGMGAYVRSNPSASLPTTNADFSGADFEGADYGTSSIGGADFEGYVQTMGNDVENAVDADSMFCDDDYGSDVATISGIDF